MTTKERFNLKVNEVMNSKEKAEELVKKYWNALDEIDTLQRKLDKVKNHQEENPEYPHKHTITINGITI